MAKKPLRFKEFDSVDTNEEVTDEALTVQQRMAKSRQMKKLAPKIAIGRKRAARKMANMDTLKKRARKAARNTILKKLTKDIPKDELSMSRRQDIEKRLDKMKPKIDKLAQKMLPKVRKKELERKRGRPSAD